MPVGKGQKEEIDNTEMCQVESIMRKTKAG